MKKISTFFVGKDCLIFEEKIDVVQNGMGLTIDEISWGPKSDVPRHVISQITEDSPANKSRLKVGDEILQVNDRVILGCEVPEVNIFLKELKNTVFLICSR